MNRKRVEAFAIAAFPVILTAGILTIPVVSDYSDHVLAEQAASHTARWFWGRVLSAVGFGIRVLPRAFVVSPSFPPLLSVGTWV